MQTLEQTALHLRVQMGEQACFSCGHTNTEIELATKPSSTRASPCIHSAYTSAHASYS